MEYGVFPSLFRAAMPCGKETANKESEDIGSESSERGSCNTLYP